MTTVRPLDPRRNAYREDLAAASLRDRVRAPRYSEGEVRQVSAPQAPIRMGPRFDSPLATEALSGELVTVYDERGGWAWAQTHYDGYVGYMPLDCLTMLIEQPTHKISSRASFVYPAPDMKLPPIMRLSFGSEVIVSNRGARDARFYELSRGGYIFSSHLTPCEDFAKDFVRVAERLVGAPYLWGGRTSNGLDCSALTQLALQAGGFACPRDSDMQEAEVGEAASNIRPETIRRGDLLFWKGHVALALSGEWLIHASGHHMETVVEPIRRALDRIAETHGPVRTVRRLPDYMAQG
jgi:hypothetical protein